MKLALAIITVALATNPAQAESWKCTYKGTWGQGEAITWKLTWDHAAAGDPWKITGDYDDASGHATITGKCQNKKCDFDQTYTSGDYNGKHYYWTASYTDKKSSPTASETTLTGTWGHAVTDRVKGGRWKASGPCNLVGGADAAAKPAGPAPALDAVYKATPATVVSLLGEPTSKAPVTEEGMTGNWVSDWKWPARGLTVTMSAATKTGAPTVSFVVLEGPTAIKTRAGITIGSKRADVEKAYKGQINKTKTNAGQVFVGKLDGGTNFVIENGAVLRIVHGEHMMEEGE